MKILILDLENSYITGGVWGLWGVNVSIDQILDCGKVLSYAFKWYGKKDTTFLKHTDAGFLETIHAALDEADAVVTFNGKRHDIPLLNREFIKGGYGPPSPYKQVDLYETAKKQFKFPSNKLQWLLTELKLGTKFEHEGFPLWIKVLKDDAVAWKTMERYNRDDVKLTEKLYRKLLPWITSHPNYNLFGKTGVCTNCGGHHFHSRGTAKTQTGIYPRLKCLDCGKWMRGRFTITDKKTRKDILVEAL